MDFAFKCGYNTYLFGEIKFELYVLFAGKNFGYVIIVTDWLINRKLFFLINGNMNLNGFEIEVVLLEVQIVISFFLEVL